MSEWDLPDDTKSQSIERTGGFLWDSGVYDANVEMVYMDQAQSGAVSFNVVMKNDQGKSLKESFYIRSGNAKGNKTYYEKDGVKYPLPGYAVANSLCIAALGQGLAAVMSNSANIEKKQVMIYDPAQSKEVAQERPVIMALRNVKVKVAVHQIKEDKTAKNQAGQYVPTGEARSKNECKFFGNTAGFSSEEIENGVTEAAVFDTWSKQNTGAVIDKTSKDATAAVNGQSAADIMGGTDTAAGDTGASMFD